ncbi:Alpha/Beta hydrolase protein [Chytriomyces sp. MP71]|nr:Alpha/Beta hydrolase protein [Chytriomyces sp. MP71]
MDPETSTPLAFQTYFDRKVYIPVDSTDTQFSRDCEILNELATQGGEWIVRDIKGSTWIVAVTKAASQPQVYEYDRVSKQYSLLFDTRPELRNVALHPTRLIETVSTFDGTPVFGFLTVPRTKQGSSDELTSEVLPLVVDVHQGPAYKPDYFACNPLHQLLAERGYAVFAPMYRGSPTFGRKVQLTAEGMFGRPVQQDILESTDSIQWTIDNKVADPSKIACHGQSYGGHISTVTATQNPTLYRGLINMTGPSDIRGSIRLLGIDVESEEGKNLLRTHSAVSNAATFKTPVLLAHGGLDHPVRLGTGEALAKGMEGSEDAAEAVFVLFPNEGHGFYHANNVLAYGGIVEAFLAKYLGGRVESCAEDVASSTAEFRIGGVLV